MTIENIREQFPITRHYNFLNHAAIAPLSRPAVEALRAYADEQSEYAYLQGKCYDGIEKVRQSAARL
ncbi:MAG: aminotransferase class V-fold PLP-dependent enzyme, partial [Phycisphaerae bacterium]|nr:aminotransferase class V-fold PLP-dependent enzyme [Phycisphaerae bacterium]